MKATKQHDTYNALHHCLEAHFGNCQAARTSRATLLARNATHGGRDWKYREPEQGFRTVPFLSSYPLQLDYMQRRKPSAHRFSQITGLFKNRNPFA